MFDLSTIFVSVANAAEVVPNIPPSVGGEMMRFMPLFLIFMVFYFLLIRPQQKKMDAQNKMLSALKKGDKVVASGLMGTIVKIENEDVFVIELSKGVQVRALRSAVSSLQSDGKKPANNDKKK